MKNFIIILLTGLVLIIASCSESTAPESTDVLQKQAVLHWQGDYAVDGCGFFVEIDSKMYKPSNEQIISDRYKQNSETQVSVRFRYLDHKINSYCFDAPSAIASDGIEIIEISDFACDNLIGEWEWVESSGGIAGVTLIPETVGYTQTYKFSSDSDLFIYKNDTLVAQTIYHLNGDTLRIEGQDIYMIVVFKTNRIILYDQCVDCFTNTFERKGVTPELLRISGIWYSLNLTSDPVEIYDVNLNGDIINLDIGYSGCVGHDFELFAPSFFMESNPVQIPVGLYHKSSYDMCALFTRTTISFDLIPIKEQYQEYYHENGSIRLNLFVLGDSSMSGTQILYEF